MTGQRALVEAVGAAVKELSEVSADQAADGSTAWRRAGVPFAVVGRDGSAVQVRVGPAIAAAAVRTPDTSPGVLGPDWVAFAPPELDGHAFDRLEAWMAAAHRRATTHP